MWHRNVYDPLLDRLVKSSGVSRDALARVLSRTMVVAPNPVTRADIAKGSMLARQTKLNPAIVSKAVTAMIDPLVAGLLSEETASAGRPQGGRPTKPLTLGSDKWGVMGISVSHSNHRPVALTGIISGLRLDEARGDILLEETQILPEEATFHDLPERLSDFAVNLREQLYRQERREHPRQLLGVGVQVAAPVFDGKVIGGSLIGIPVHSELDLATPIQEALGLPVTVDNDVNVLAVRELYRRNYPERDIAMVAVLQDGVGASLILDGHVYRGGQGMAGEPGHQHVTPWVLPDSLNSPVEVCHCKKENHVDCFAVPERLRKQLNLSSFAEAASIDAYTASGLTSAGWVFSRGGDALGQGIAAIINIINPSRVLLLLPPELASAELGENTAAAAYRDALEASVDKYSFNQEGQIARANGKRLTVASLDPSETPHVEALCAALRALDDFVQHARGRDGCELAG